MASSSSALLSTWKLGLQGLYTVVAVDDVDSLAEAIVRIKPCVLLLDLELPALGGAAGIARLWALDRGIRFVVFGAVQSEEAELALFLGGVRGCCPRDLDPQRLPQVVEAVQQGELWIRRSLTPRLLDELVARCAHERPLAASPLRLTGLTEREREIALLVGAGETNKHIARRLDITERTVKSHLTETFRKLGIADRLRLALLVTSSDAIGTGLSPRSSL